MQPLSFLLAEVLALGFQDQREHGFATNAELLFLSRSEQRCRHNPLLKNAFVVICCFEAAERTKEC